ncbi:MAG: GAF domain-containing protein [Cytophagales bacterium]|nr:MAG: GAF domain-containing protein [Cytophagales bacterium]
MKRISFISTLAVLLFILGTFFSIYQLYQWHSQLAEQLNLRKNAENIAYFNEVTFNLFLISGVQAALALLAILLLLVSRRGRIKLVYVDRYISSNNAQSNNQNENQNNGSHQNTNLLEPLIKDIQLTNENEQTKLEKILWKVCNHTEAVQGAIYLRNESQDTFSMVANYAYFTNDSQKTSFQAGEGLLGQVVKTGNAIEINNLPEGYIDIVSGLGKSQPKTLQIIPIQTMEKQIVGVVELAYFKQINETQKQILEELASLIAEEFLKNEHKLLS